MAYAPLHDEQLAVNLKLLHAVKENETASVLAALQTAELDFGCLEEPLNLQTPLRCACAKGNAKMARLLLLNRADVFAHFEVDGWTALHSACHGGHDHVARLLLEEAPWPNHFEGWSLLHLLTLAASKRLLSRGAELLSWFLKHCGGAEVNAVSTRVGYLQWTPLHLAAIRGYSEILTVLLKAKADPCAATGEFNVSSVQLNRLAAGDEAAVGCIVAEGGEDLDRGLLALHLAAFGGHQRACQLLIRHSPKAVNGMTQSHCWTPLMYGVWSKNVKLVRELCRLGGRKSVNDLDRHSNGTQWSPLALAVVRASTEMLQALLEYGADPLVRLASADFPGRAFMKQCAALPDAANNAWSDKDQQISLLHLAVCRGSAAMLETLIPVVKSAHQRPVRKGKPPIDGIPWQDARAEALATVQERARRRLRDSPEAQDRNPVSFLSLEGWSPVVLAVLLHTVDPGRKVRCFPMTQNFPDPPASREEVFMTLVAHGALDDEEVASVPQRFPDVAESLAIMALKEFGELCQKADKEMVAQRILHSSLCMACHFNRINVVRHLLQAQCDPCCSFLDSIERRPLHLAASCGHGEVAQLLLDFKADPLEDDENRERPVFKLAKALEGKAQALQARVYELEALLQATPKPTTSPKRGGKRCGGGPVLLKRYDSLLDDSRM